MGEDIEICKYETYLTLNPNEVIIHIRSQYPHFLGEKQSYILHLNTV